MRVALVKEVKTNMVYNNGSFILFSHTPHSFSPTLLHYTHLNSTPLLSTHLLSCLYITIRLNSSPHFYPLHSYFLYFTPFHSPFSHLHSTPLISSPTPTPTIYFTSHHSTPLLFIFPHFTHCNLFHLHLSHLRIHVHSSLLSTPTPSSLLIFSPFSFSLHFSTLRLSFNALPILLHGSPFY